MKVLVVGSGNMGYAFAKAFIEGEVIHPQHMLLFDKNPDRIEFLEKEGLAPVFSEFNPLFNAVKIIILAIKPQQATEVLEQLKPYTNEDQIILSIMAGYPIKAIQDGLNTDKVVRIMPNLPLLVGKGILGYNFANTLFEREELEVVKSLLMTTGDIVEVDSEDQIDAVTSMSGSGPAYIYYFMQSMKEAGLKVGFSEAESKKLTLATFKGALELYEQNDISFEEWINRVSSKGGTTEAAIKTFKAEGIHDSIEKGISAAYNRAKELGK